VKNYNFKQTLFNLTLSFILSIAANKTVRASDHIDFTGGGSNSAVPRELDLTDLFAWVPAPGRLVLGLNTNLAATPLNKFSNSHSYRFRLRQLNVDLKNTNPIQVPTIITDVPELTIVCKVNENTATCTSPNFSAETKLNEEQSSDTIYSKGARLFAGLRADPFILDIAWAGKYTKLSATKGDLPPDSNPLPLAEPKNFSDYLNVLNFTLEIDTTKLFKGNAEFIAVAADVIEETATGIKIIDRVGRPELTNMTIRADAVKEIYNTVDTYNLPESVKPTFLTFIGAGISGWDSLDKIINWNANDLEQFKQTLVNDFLVVDLKELCTNIDNVTGETTFVKSSYLDIETNRRKESGHFQSCGGRVPTEDIIDTLVSYYTAGPKSSNVIFGDGVNKVRNSSTTKWPYFAGPFLVKANP
jgi:hypothetical protein